MKICLFMCMSFVEWLHKTNTGCSFGVKISTKKSKFPMSVITDRWMDWHFRVIVYRVTLLQKNIEYIKENISRPQNPQILKLYKLNDYMNSLLYIFGCCHLFWIPTTEPHSPVMSFTIYYLLRGI